MSKLVHQPFRLAADQIAIPDKLEYVGEFGAELLLFLPFVTWLSRTGLLQNAEIVTYRGMRCFYEGLKCKGIIERPDARKSGRDGTLMPVAVEHSYLTPSPFHAFPNMRRMGNVKLINCGPAFKQSLSTKPLLIVHNKYNIEWRRKQYNFYTLDVLDRIFATLAKYYTIVYIRHGIRAVQTDYSSDRNTFKEYDDFGVVKAHPSIFLFDDLYDAVAARIGAVSVNEFKLSLYRRAYHFITTQGGGAHQCAYYSGSLLTVLHKMGREIENAYAEGYYSFLANPAPTRAICANDAELVEALALYRDPAVLGGVARIPPGTEALLHHLSPWEARARWEGETTPNSPFRGALAARKPALNRPVWS